MCRNGDYDCNELEAVSETTTFAATPWAEAGTLQSGDGKTRVSLKPQKFRLTTAK
jgi:hypothetical protein